MSESTASAGTNTDSGGGNGAPLPRPQALGALDGPAGLMLVGPRPGAEELLTRIATVGVPDEWPVAGEALRLAHNGDVDGALRALGTGRDDVINRLVLAPTPEHLAEARVAAADDPSRRAVVAAAAYASGLSDDPPRLAGVDGEFAVLALTVLAARAVEFSDAPSALRLLREAADRAAEVGPALHGRVLGMVAEHRFRRQHAVEASLEWYDRAIDVLASTRLDEVRAGLQLERGLALHQLSDVQPHRLVEAVRSYQSATIVLTEDRDPERFATANMHIGTAYLSMPMSQASDQVRLGVAVQSLRAALRVYRPETHPWEWSSSQLNLANALQYLPSTHRRQNLEEAVGMYDEVLAHRSARSDPAGHARVLANQANALAHLGRLDPATERYVEARALFAAAGEADAVEVVDRQLAEIAHTAEAAS